MKNNKGFTLVEILAVIVILLIIVVIAAPNMTKEIKRGEDASQNVLNQKIENAAHLYAAKYYADAIVNCNSSIDNPCVKFSLYNLEQDGLINLSNEGCSTSESIKIYKYNDKIMYDYEDINSCYKCPASAENDNFCS